MADANAKLIERYIALQSFPAFENTSIPDIVQPMPYGGWKGARMLLFTQAALGLQSGHEEPALAFLARGHRFVAARVLGAGNLIDEALAVRTLASDYRMLSNAIASDAFDVRRYESQLRSMLTPLDPKERNAALVFKKEFELHARLVTTMPDQLVSLRWLDRALSKLLYKPNASLNRITPFYIGVQALASRSPAEFEGLRHKLQVQADEMSEPDITWVYNPIGKVLTAIAIPAYPDFIARVFDLAAFVQLVGAQLDLRLAAVEPDQMATFLADTGPDTRNPYTGQPFAWDAATRELSFKPTSNRWMGWSTRTTVPPPASKR